MQHTARIRAVALLGGAVGLGIAWCLLARAYEQRRQAKRGRADDSEDDENDDASRSRTVVVQLLCTNDTHSKMEPLVRGAAGGFVGGALRRARALRRLRGAVERTLVFDAGDHFSGSEYFQSLQGEAEMTLLDRLGYDATALGNHDFDGAVPGGTSGLARLRAVASAHAPGLRLLCANVEVAQGAAADNGGGATPAGCVTGAAAPAGGGAPDGARLSRSRSSALAPWCVLTRGGVRVGVAAVLGTQAWAATPAKLRRGLALSDPTDAAHRCAAELEAEGCDVLVLLSHTGVTRGDKEVSRQQQSVVRGGGEEEAKGEEGVPRR